MSSGDFFEWITLMAMLPLGTAALFFRCLTGLYVYIDTEKRSRNRLYAALLALSVSVYYWPIGFLAYIACTAAVDNRRRSIQST